MSKITYCAIVLMLLMMLAGCTIDPVRPQAVYEATATARAESTLLPTVTPSPEPPLPKVEPAVAPEPTAECAIKGNISSSGEKIYHLPGQATYGTTVIDPARGERMFCTEAEAVAAGWRKAER